MEWRRFVTYLWNDPRILIGHSVQTMAPQHFVVAVGITAVQSVRCWSMTLQSIWRTRT